MFEVREGVATATATDRDRGKGRVKMRRNEVRECHRGVSTRVQTHAVSLQWRGPLDVPTVDFGVRISQSRVSSPLPSCPPSLAVDSHVHSPIIYFGFHARIKDHL
jgi:hypothetical protein